MALSIGCNIFFFYRKNERENRVQEILELHYYKNISYVEGCKYFFNQLKNEYQELDINRKHFIVYRWDSLLYDFIYEEQMRVLDSMAARIKENDLECILVTEMDDEASKSFLENRNAKYKNLKMLFRMDDFISGTNKLKDLKLKNTAYDVHQLTIKINHNIKPASLYLIMNSKGVIMYSSEKYSMILKDSIFLRKINDLISEKDFKIQN